MTQKTGKRYSEAQIIRVLEQVDKGQKVEDICREHGISAPTFHRWKKRYGGLSQTELTKIKGLESENARLKRLLAERDLEIDAIKEKQKKKW